VKVWRLLCQPADKGGHIWIGFQHIDRAERSQFGIGEDAVYLAGQIGWTWTTSRPPLDFGMM